LKEPHGRNREAVKKAVKGKGREQEEQQQGRERERVEKAAKKLLK
jgi:hypothetical protein